MTTSNALATIDREGATITELPRRSPGDVMFEVLAKGDLNNLTPEEIARYEVAVCESVGLNPLTKPFDVITLPGRDDTSDRKVMYANRNAGDQLTKLYNITRQIVSRELVDGVYVVTARATAPDGRSDESIGAVSLVKEGGTWKTTEGGKRYFSPDGTVTPLRPDERANKMMHAETKAKRRAVLSLVGLSMLDESELDTLRTMAPARADVVASPRGLVRDDGRTVDAETGEITEARSFATPDRDAEAKALGKAIIAAFDVNATKAKQIGEDLICWRFGYQESKRATADELAQVRAAVERWQIVDVAVARYEALRLVGSALTESMATDTMIHLREQGIDDPFVLAALADRLREFDAAVPPDLAAVDAAVDAAVRL